MAGLKCLAFILVAALLSPLARADDQSDVKAAAKAYSEAVAVRDVGRMKACVTAESGRFVDGFVEMVKAFERLNEAGMARFKERISENQFVARDAKELEAGEVTIDGEMATLTLKGEQDKPGRRVALKRESGAWKVNFVANMKSKPERIAAFFAASSKAAGEVAEEIRGGKYKSADEARAAVQEKIAGALRGGRGMGRVLNETRVLLAANSAVFDSDVQTRRELAAEAASPVYRSGWACEGASGGLTSTTVVRAPSAGRRRPGFRG